MEDTLLDKDATLAKELGQLLAEHKGINVVVLDLRSLNTWTDFFIISTVTSSTHLKGLQRHIKEFTTERDIEIIRRQRKIASDDEWNLIDLGTMVIHLMTEKSRTFYDLERLWSGGSLIWKNP
jgi:ribosome-associated protein